MSLEDDLRAHARQVVDFASEDLVGLLRDVAPVRSGHLQSTIEDPVVDETDREVVAVVRVNADYAESTNMVGALNEGWYSSVVDLWEAFLEAAERAI